MRSLRSATVVAAIALPGLLAAQSVPTSLERTIDDVFAPVSRTDTPGCALGVDRSGAPLLRRSYGMANLETGTPFTIATLSESGSTAKQFVAAALVMLARDGVLALDDDIVRWIPEVKGFGRRITVRQLLSHTSGLPDRYGLHEAMGRAAGEVDHTNAEVLDIVSRLRDLNFDPGDDYLYSNTGYVVAVAVLERASGKSLQAFTNERIFAPLGMTDTRWREDHRVVVSRRASAYSGNATTGFRNEHPFTRVFGSGGLLLTIPDFLKWAGALQAGTGAWGAVRDSLEAVIRLNDGTPITYGLGVVTETWRGVRRVSHTGATGGYRAAIYRYPQQQVAIAVLCNSPLLNSSDVADRVASAVMEGALAPVPTPIAPALAVLPASLDAIAGAYRAPRTDDVLLLQVRDGTLRDSLTGATLLPWGADLFRVRGTDRVLRISGSGATRTLREEAPGERMVEYAREAAPVTGAAALASYAATYRSPELDAVGAIVARGDSLFLDGGWRGRIPLTPLFRDGFGMPGNQRLRFTRDARGRVTGFTLWAGRVRHLRFDRARAR